MTGIIKKVKEQILKCKQKRIDAYNDAVRERAADCINIREMYEPHPDKNELQSRVRVITVFGEVAYIEGPNDSRKLLDILNEARQAYYLRNCKHPKRKLM